MWYLIFGAFSHFRKGTRRTHIVLTLCLTCVAIVLASCGSATAAQQLRPVTTIPTLTSSPTAIPTPKPITRPTPKPTPKPTTQPIVQPTVAPQPTQPPVAPAPAILDVRPSSMSIVGHLDCQQNGAFICFARVLSETNNQSNLQWVAFTNVPGNIVFSPASGVLAPGQSVLVTITVPLNACTTGLFFFRGPANTHTITWAC